MTNVGPSIEARRMPHRDPFEPAPTSPTYSPPMTEPTPTDTSMGGGGGSTGGTTDVTLAAAHPNGAPVQAPVPTFWTFEQAQAAGTLNPNFQSRVDALIAASGGRIWLTSGFRDHAKQERLYAQSLKDHPGEAGKWVAVPGRSNHEKGEAADIHGDMGWLHQNAAEFGLTFPMSWEPWHVEPAGLRGQSKPEAYTQGPVGTMNPTVDPTIDSQPSEVMASTAALLSSPLVNPSQASPGASFSTAVTGGLTDKSGQPPSAEGGKAQGVDTRGANVATDTTTGAVAAPPPSSTGQAQDTTLSVAGSGSWNGQYNMSDEQRASWANDFLTTAKLPVTSDNIRAVVAWQKAESGGGGGAYNPLNTTQGGYEGETNINSVGVKSYTSYQDGIAANVKVLYNGYYGPIISALQSGDNAESVVRSIGQTPWGTGYGAVGTLGNTPNFQSPAPPAPAAPAKPARPKTPKPRNAR